MRPTWFLPFMRSKRMTHPDLYDRMVNAGLTPNYPRPAPPPRVASLIGLATLILALVVGAYTCRFVARALTGRFVRSEASRPLESRRRLRGSSRISWRSSMPTRRPWSIPCLDQIGGSIVRIVLQESGQAVEVGAGLDEADDGDQGLGVDQRLERHIVQVELAGARRPSRRRGRFDQGR